MLTTATTSITSWNLFINLRYFFLEARLF